MLSIINRLKNYRKRNKAWYKRDYKQFIKMQRGQCPEFEVKPSFPCVKERDSTSGTASGAYFHQDILAARHIFNSKPRRHVDIGSRIDGFVAHVSIFREIEVFDLRPLDSNVKNISFKVADFMASDSEFANYCDSISSLHAIEHFGLGRYGDQIDPLGHIKGVDNITKMLVSGGYFYFSVPLGPLRIEFNAHRIFSLQYLIDWLLVKYDLIEFSYVDDNGDIHESIELNSQMVESNCSCNHGCAIFVLKKK